MGKKGYTAKEGLDSWINMQNRKDSELRGLRLLKKNLESGVILRISPGLVRLLMEKDWTNG